MTTFNQIVKPGKTKIYYMRQDALREYFGSGKMPTVATLLASHALLGSTQETNAEKVYMLCQDWQSDGEANDWLENIGVAHTSMSMGDVVEIDGQYFVVDMLGFKEIA